MATYNPVDRRLWHDRKFLALSDDGRMVWLFLLTTSFYRSIPGVIVAGDGAMSEELGWTVERFQRGLGEVVSKGLRVRREGRLLWLPNALKYQPISGGNHIVGMAKIWDDIPDGAVKSEIWQALKIACKKWSAEFAKGFPKPLPLGPAQPPTQGGSGQEQEQEQEQDQEQEREAAHPLPARERHPAIGGIARRTWNTAAKAHAALRASGVDPTMPPWPVMPSTGHPGWEALLDRVAETLVDTTEAEAEAVCMRRIAVGEAEASTKANARWFTPLAMFTPKSWAIATSLTVEQVSRASAGGGKESLRSRLDQQAERVRMLEAQEEAQAAQAALAAGGDA